MYHVPKRKMRFYELIIIRNCTNDTINGTIRLYTASLSISSKCLVRPCIPCSHAGISLPMKELVTAVFQVAYQCLLIHFLPNSLLEREKQKSGCQNTCWNVSTKRAPRFPHLQDKDDITYLCGLLKGLRADAACAPGDTRDVYYIGFAK